MEKRWFMIGEEHECGWGSRVEIVIEYETKELAEAAANEINKENTAPSAPACYWTGRVSNDLNWLYHKEYHKAKPRVRVKMGKA